MLEPRGTLRPEMDPPMACTANCNEIFFHIASQSATRLPMMNLEVFRISASLASPAIAFEHSLAQLSIEVPVQAKPWLSWDPSIHAVVGIRSKNSCRCEFGSSR